MARLSRRCLLQGGLTWAGLSLLTGCEVMSPGAPPPATARRIGVLGFGAGPPPQTEAFLHGMRDLGHVESEKLAIEWR